VEAKKKKHERLDLAYRRQAKVEQELTQAKD